jgi:hypothetical protein
MLVNFNLISEDDVEKQTIDDFSDDEIMEEVRKKFMVISLLFQKTSLLDSQNNRERIKYSYDNEFEHKLNI